MGKITVTEKIILEGVDINEWAEVAKPSENRSFVNFDSSNVNLIIDNNSYNKQYVTVYDSTSNSASKGISDRGYQASHGKYFGKLSNKHIWLIEKGCRPQLNMLSGIQSAPGDYTFTLIDGNRTKIESNNQLTAFNTSARNTTIDAAIFYITFVCGGGSGCQGYAQVNNWALFGLLSSEWYTAATLLIDMTKIPGGKFTLTIGGSGQASKISVNSTAYVVLNAGASGGKCKSGSNTNWGDASNTSKNNNTNAGAGGSVTFTSLSGIIKVKTKSGSKGAGSCSMSATEQYSENKKTIDYVGYAGSNGYGNGGAGSIFANGGHSPNGYDQSAGNGQLGSGGGGGTVPDASWWWNASGSCSAGSGGTGAFKLYY